MTYRAMLIAGWLSVLSSFVTIPVAYLSWKLEGRIDAKAVLIQSCIQILGILLFLAIILCLKRLLNASFRFHEVDKEISWLIKTNVMAGIITIASLQATDLNDTFGLAAIILIAAQGIVQVRFGYRLLKLNDPIGGMLKSYCYLNMATGVCIASLILILVGMVLSAVSDLMLGTIFFYMASRSRQMAPPVAEE